MERKFDELGRIVIPREFRKKIGLENGEAANIELEDNKIIVTNPKEPDYKAIVEKATEFLRDNAMYNKNTKRFDLELDRTCCKELLNILDKKGE